MGLLFPEAGRGFIATGATRSRNCRSQDGMLAYGNVAAQPVRRHAIFDKEAGRAVVLGDKRE